jgi:hypothetical protein
LGNIQDEIDDCNRAIAVWYRDKTGSTGTIEEIIEPLPAAPEMSSPTPLNARPVLGGSVPVFLRTLE